MKKSSKWINKIEEKNTKMGLSHLLANGWSPLTHIKIKDRSWWRCTIWWTIVTQSRSYAGLRKVMGLKSRTSTCSVIRFYPAILLIKIIVHSIDNWICMILVKRNFLTIKSSSLIPRFQKVTSTFFTRYREWPTWSTKGTQKDYNLNNRLKCRNKNKERGPEHRS